jgi:membrane associated rhomboid family serine protease
MEARKPWVTFALIAANVAMFVVELAHGVSLTSPTPQQIIDLGGSFPPLTLHGEWWRLGSSMFLHFGALHIALNLLCLYQARVVEQLFGHAGFAVIYGLAGLGGGIASLLVSNGHTVTAGASGAVFGVYGAFGAFLLLRRSQIQEDAWQRTARSIGRFLLLNLVIGVAVPSISISAHVGGVIVGFGAGAALLAGARAVQQRVLRTLGVAVLGVALTVVAMMTIHGAADVTPVLTRFDTVEHASVTQLNEAVHRHEIHELTDGEFADLLERDVIAPYREMHQDLAATQDAPARLRPLLAQLTSYTAAHLAAWAALDAGLREADPEKRTLRFADHKRLKAEVDDRRAAYQAELARLKP